MNSRVTFVVALRRAAWPLLVFWAAMDLLELVLLDPLILSILERIIALGDDRFVGNAALASFAASPAGIVALVTAATGSILVNVLIFGGTAVILWDARNRRPTGLFRVFRALLGRAPTLLAISAFATGVALLFAAPVVVAALAARGHWLSGGDLYFYLTTRPPEFFRAITAVGAVAVIAGAVAFVVLLRLCLAVPISLLKPAGAVAALRASAHATRGRELALAVKLAGVFLFLLALWAVAAAALAGLLHWLVARQAIDALPHWAGAAFALCVALAVGALTSVSRAAIVLVLLSDKAAGDALPPSAVPLEVAAGPARLRGALVLLACVVILGVAVAGTVSAAATVPIHDIQITAHRAGSARAPENTVAALENAIAEGADVVEIDVQETADGEIVLLHDTDLRRVAGVARFVWEMPLAELQGLDAGSWFSAQFRNERIPTLRAFAMASWGRIRLNVELKDNGRGEDLAARVVAILRETGVADGASVTSLDLRLLRQVRSIAPEIKLGLILATGVGNLRAVDVDFVALARRLATPAVIRQFALSGRGVHVWTLDDEASVTQVMLDGADNIITGDPLMAIAVRRKLEELTEPERALLRIGHFYRRALTLSRI